MTAFRIHRTLTTETGEIDPAAVERRAAEIAQVKRWPQPFTGCDPILHDTPQATTDAARALAQREAEAEKARCDWQTLANLEIESRRRSERLDAEALAMNFEFDVERLQFHRDRWFWGNSTARPIQLPRYELALKIARERAAKPVALLQAAE